MPYFPKPVSLDSHPTTSWPINLQIEDPSNAEVTAYMEKYDLPAFFHYVTMYISKHFPPDPFEFLLSHIESLVASHRASSPQPTPTHEMLPPPEISDQDRESVIRHVAAILENSSLTQASANKLFTEFAACASTKTGTSSLREEDFARLTSHLKSVWGLALEDIEKMNRDLKRWRLHKNLVEGTFGLPLWPLTLDDFESAYPKLLRSIRDRYLPLGGNLRKSLFVRQGTGNLCNKYDLGPLLGSGAFGEVRLATLRATNEKRVCKIIERRPQHVQGSAIAEEFELLRALDHPHIIRVYEFFENGDFFELIMEPVFGGTLTHIVQGLFGDSPPHSRPAALTETWIATVLHQLLSAMAYAHGVAGVIHKDIKTDNVLMVGQHKMSPDELLKEPVHAMLADFGLAEAFPLNRSLNDVTTRARSTNVQGSPATMSPEMYKGSFTEKSDIWSTGVVMFQLLTGQLPYSAKNVMALCFMVSDPRAHPRWDLCLRYAWSLGARQFCQQLLSKDEALRPCAIQASQNAWLTKTHVSHENSPPTDSEKVSLHLPHIQTHLMRTARLCITSQLNLSQLHRLNARFEYYDESGDGRLSPEEMHHVLDDIGITSSKEIQLIFESLDVDHSGHVDYSEFVASCIDFSSDNMKLHLQTVFSIFDLDGSGTISLEELHQVLTHGANTPSSPTWQSRAPSSICMDSLLPDGKTVEALMSELDQNGNGVIEYAEFERYLLEEHRKHACNVTNIVCERDLTCCEGKKEARPCRPQQPPPQRRRPHAAVRRRKRAQSDATSNQYGRGKLTHPSPRLKSPSPRLTHPSPRLKSPSPRLMHPSPRLKSQSPMLRHPALG